MSQNSRITGGEFRGRELVSPNSESTHPMGSRERLALMNSLGPDVLKDAHVLDAFAGTGALGFEALSRGAADVVFIEFFPPALKAIRKNIDLLDVKSRTRIFARPAQSYHIDAEFDLLFIDPPYKRLSLDAFSHLIKNNLKPGGYLVLSHHRLFDAKALEATHGLTITFDKQYAAAGITIFRKNPETSRISTSKTLNTSETSPVSDAPSV